MSPLVPKIANQNIYFQLFLMNAFKENLFVVLMVLYLSKLIEAFESYSKNRKTKSLLFILVISG